MFAYQYCCFALDDKSVSEEDVPPLPKKRSSFIKDDINTPPPLPVKRDSATNLLSSPGNNTN